MYQKITVDFIFLVDFYVFLKIAFHFSSVNVFLFYETFVYTWFDHTVSVLVASFLLCEMRKSEKIKRSSQKNQFWKFLLLVLLNLGNIYFVRLQT